MARGKCSGCGTEDVNANRMRRHVSQCPEYARLYREHPERCLEPEEEMQRFREYRASEAGQDAKQDVKDERQDRWTQFQETKTERSQTRWSGESGRFAEGNPLSPEEVLALPGARMYGERIDSTEGEELSPTRRVILRGFVGSL